MPREQNDSNERSQHLILWRNDPEFNVKEFWSHLKWLGVQNFLVTQLLKFTS